MYDLIISTEEWLVLVLITRFICYQSFDLILRISAKGPHWSSLLLESVNFFTEIWCTYKYFC